VTRVVVALSGGVDSAVAAALLVEQGYEVVGIMMRLWSASERPLENRCCSSEAVDDARRVSQLLDIPFYLVNYEREFRERVVDYFLAEYGQGRTPNPCLACNRHIKFDLLLKRALSLDAEYLATGHYCRVRYEAGRYHLLRGVDGLKDQSYMLHVLGQEQLAHVLFPLGDFTKEQVRALAAERGLPVAEKAESQDLCFVPTGDYRPFLRASRPEALVPGAVVDVTGRELGRHEGLALYTIGQRHGLGSVTGGQRPAEAGSADPLYVVGLDHVHNTVILGQGDALLRDHLIVREPTFVAGHPPVGRMRVSAKVRYRSPDTPATVSMLQDGRVLVTFDQPQRAITPGQAVVFYQGDEVLGGGLIALE